MSVRIYRFGENALVLAHEPPASIDVQRRIWAVASNARRWPGVTEAVVGMNNVTLFFEHGSNCGALEAALSDAWKIYRGEPVAGKVHDIAVRYGDGFGPDLAEVAQRCGMTEPEAVRLHCEREYQVYFLGFQPGFAYLGDLNERLQLPRRSEPRSAVMAGSVAVAGLQTAIYPVRAPGGWHIIGRTEVRPFDPGRAQPVLFSPGDRVRFHAVSVT